MSEAAEQAQRSPAFQDRRRQNFAPQIHDRFVLAEQPANRDISDSLPRFEHEPLAF